MNMNMKLRYFSDLHLEFIKPNKIDKFIEQIAKGENEICILSGDIGNPYQENYNKFMNFISENFKKSFIIAGNHEYYNKTKTIQETNDYLQEYFTKFDNITFLNNNFEYYNDYYFIGTTLWTKITNPENKINDVFNIPFFDYIECNKLHLKSIEFLENVIHDKNKCIIITHHVPSNTLIDDKYKTLSMKPYNQWFYCSMDSFIQQNKDKIKCWFYGHTHTFNNTKINDIPFLCNPIGYPNENKNINFETSIILNNSK